MDGLMLLGRRAGVEMRVRLGRLRRLLWLLGSAWRRVRDVLVGW